MQFQLITNPDRSKSLAYKIARVVYAETGAKSLRVVEALTSMIKNFSVASEHDMEQIISDSNVFEVLKTSSPYHERMFVAPTSCGFQMCLRVAVRMLHGMLPDCCYGATQFHHDNTIPKWATSRGYIADIDGLLFYL